MSSRATRPNSPCAILRAFDTLFSPLLHPLPGVIVLTAARSATGVYPKQFIPDREADQRRADCLALPRVHLAYGGPVSGRAIYDWAAATAARPRRRLGRRWMPGASAEPTCIIRPPVAITLSTASAGGSFRWSITTPPATSWKACARSDCSKLTAGIGPRRTGSLQSVRSASRRHDPRRFHSLSRRDGDRPGKPGGPQDQYGLTRPQPRPPKQGQPRGEAGVAHGCSQA